MDDGGPPRGGLVRRLFRSRFASLYLCGAVMLAAATALRTVLLIYSWSTADTGIAAIVGMYAAGLGLDLAACFITLFPAAILLALAPDRLVARRGFRWSGIALFALGVFLALYEATVEGFFWAEFFSRFNLVAVEYLKDTEEVVGNIQESYPVLRVSLALLAGAALIVALTARTVNRSYLAPTTLRGRLRGGSVFLAGALLALAAFHPHNARLFANDYTNALAQNGPICFLRAFISRTAVYHESYLTYKDAKVLPRLRQLLQTPNARYLNPDNPADISRQITAAAPELRRNVVVIVIESFSASFTNSLNPAREGPNLTPEFDALAGQGLFLRNLYATGTRTIRGLEAITLSLPPTPGLAVVKRPHANELFSVERLLKSKGYSATFLYGGRGRFDSMNSFLGQDAFRIIDQTNFAPDEISFKTAWGVCDEDLYRRVLKECDTSYAKDRGKPSKPFFTMVMTVSNHVPYTFPNDDNKIDLKSGTMEGAVKYTDYALGQFIRQARTKDWFPNTVFLIVADHCSRKLTKKVVSPARYHIPALFFAPGFIPPAANDSLCSQIDLMPTLLGMLNMSYRTKFFGRDILKTPPGRAFISTPGELAMIAGGKLVILSPNRTAVTRIVNSDGTEDPADMDDALLFDAVSYYQGAGYILEHKLYQGD